MKSEGDGKMMKKFRNLGSKMALSALCGALLFASGQASAAYAYKITVTATIPKGYAGEKPSSIQPSSTKFTPCTVAKLDGVVFTVTYDAGKLTTDAKGNVVDERKDVYLILYNPDVIYSPLLGTAPFYTIKKFPLGNNQVLRGFATVQDMELDAPPTGSTANVNAKDDTYVDKASNPGIGAISEPVFGGAIILDGVTSGTWQIIGIIADRSTIDFNNPHSDSWVAWDVATIVLGKPWAANEIKAGTPLTPVAGACTNLGDEKK
jgi:hypothetical protein